MPLDGKRNATNDELNCNFSVEDSIQYLSKPEISGNCSKLEILFSTNQASTLSLVLFLFQSSGPESLYV